MCNELIEYLVFKWVTNFQNFFWYSNFLKVSLHANTVSFMFYSSFSCMCFFYSKPWKIPSLHYCSWYQQHIRWETLKLQYKLHSRQKESQLDYLCKLFRPNVYTLFISLFNSQHTTLSLPIVPFSHFHSPAWQMCYIFWQELISWISWISRIKRNLLPPIRLKQWGLCLTGNPQSSQCVCMSQQQTLNTTTLIKLYKLFPLACISNPLRDFSEKVTPKDKLTTFFSQRLKPFHTVLSPCLFLPGDSTSFISVFILGCYTSHPCVTSSLLWSSSSQKTHVTLTASLVSQLSGLLPGQELSHFFHCIRKCKQRPVPVFDSHELQISGLTRGGHFQWQGRFLSVSLFLHEQINLFQLP